MIEGNGYVAARNLEEARNFDLSVIIFQGDWGGTIYLTVPVAKVNCDQATLRNLLYAIDRLAWDEDEGAELFFEFKPAGSGVWGGMGGGMITNGLWLHPRIEELGVRDEIESVLAGESDQFDPAGRTWDDTRPTPKLP